MKFNELEKIRIKKIEKMREAGIEPYPTRSEVTHRIIEAVGEFIEHEKE